MYGLAIAWQRGSDFQLILIGRTTAVHAASVDDLLERQKAIQDAGADALFITGVKSPAVLDSLAAHATVPLILGSRQEVTAFHQFGGS